MVKFAESEKRGRGSEGGDRRLVPMMLERPKLSRALWESLKVHIMRARRQKKEEQEADKEEERLKRERENKKKQHAMTLEETKEEIANKQRELKELRKHRAEVFEQYKKRVNEEEQRKQSQQNFLKENELQNLHSYSQGTLPIGGHHPQMLFPQTIVAGRPTNLTTATVYKLPPQPPALDLKPLLQQPPVKRQRSPSPPPPSNGPSYQPLSYAFKSIGGSQASVVPVSLSTTKVGSSSNIYLGSGGPPYYHTTVQPSHIPISQYSSSVSSQPPSVPVTAAYLPAGSAPPHQSAGPSIDEKHLSSVYLPHTSRGRYKVAGHMATLHQVEHKGKPSVGSGPFPPPPGEPIPEKFYARSHHGIHGGVLPVHQAPPGSAKSGSITSGFPVRAAAPISQSTAVTSNAHTYGNHSSSYHRSYM